MPDQPSGFSEWWYDTGGGYDRLEGIAARQAWQAATARERERCAGVAEGWRPSSDFSDLTIERQCKSIAAAIRADK